MTDPNPEMNGRAGGTARRDRPGTAARRVAELGAENAALRRALAEAGLRAEEAAHRQDAELPRGRAGRADDAREARSAASDADALRRANAELAASRAALRDGEARWRGVFERMHQGFVLGEMVHEDGQAVDYRLLEVNAAWVEMTGIPAAAVVGRRFREVVPDIERFWIDTYARVAETGEPARLERHVPPLGRWYEVLAYRPGPGRFAALTLDATERKAAEARRDALVELGDRLRDLRDPAEIAGAAAEVIGRALGADRAGYGTVDAAQEVFRVERDWTAGSVAGLAGEHRLAEYWRGFAEEHGRGEAVAVGDVERDPRTAARTGAYAASDVRALLNVPVVEGGRVAAILYVHQAAPREWTAAEVAFVRGAAERAWAAAARARVEEELRAEKARLRLALDASRLGAWELDVAADSAARSPRHDAIFGYETPPPVWGFEQFMRHVLPEDRGDVERSFRAALEGGGEWHFECRIRRVDGEVRWIEAWGQPVHDAGGRQVRLLGTVADVTDRKLAEERRALLVNEMNHRAKNALALVQAMLRLTKAADVPAFVRSVEGRVAALARAHTLLADRQWAGSSLHDLVRGELAPFMAGRATIDGPAVTLPAVAAQPVAMAVHELATNAAKHGALSAAAGTVAVAWRVEGRDLRLRWTERGGPPVGGAPERSGFGSRLLDGTIRTQLRGTVERTWDASGLVCDLVVPLV